MISKLLRTGVAAGLALWLSCLPTGAQQDQREATIKQSEEQPAGVVLPAGTRIPLVLENSVNTKNAAVGDRLYFQTIYPVVLNGRILIPVGSYVRGSVTFAKRPGRIKGRGELHVRFEEMTLPNGYTVDLQASLAGAGTTGNEEVDRKEGGVKGESSKGQDARTIGTTTSAGAGVGAIAGRGKGVAIGAGAGAAAGLVATLLTRGRELVLPRGTTVEIALDRPLELDPAMVQFNWTGQSGSPLSPPLQRRPDRNPLRPGIPF